MSLPSRKDLREFAIRWNNLYPIDWWWRDKYKVPFNSPRHRAVSIFDMIIEYEEDRYVKSLLKNQEEEEKDPYKPGYGKWFKPKDDIMTEEQLDKFDLENMDLDNLYGQDGLISLTPK